MIEKPNAARFNTELRKRQKNMRYVVRFVLILILLGAIGLVSYAYFGDLSPTQQEINAPVTLEAN
jgi:uncharacterized membrane protein